ncbi:MAG: ABC transporter permease [Rickettsiales bacterium]|jgi:D-methionine transport system permease protein|nr:ABC transporter permease [Rickettsiales bacterium]
MTDLIFEIFRLVMEPTYQTVVMVFWTVFFALLMGMPIGVMLCVTSDNGIYPKPIFNKCLNMFINLFRSFPFLILMILVFPLARFIVGESIGTKASIVPLAVATTPFIARIIQNALQDVPWDIVQTAKIIGSTNWQIVRKVLIPEALPSIVSGVTLTVIAVIGNSAMAGAIGGGGLGDLAIRYGYHRFRSDIMFGAVMIIILLVVLVQWFGNKIVKKIISAR